SKHMPIFTTQKNLSTPVGLGCPFVPYFGSFSFNFLYLGITLQPTTKSFSAHVQERAAAAIRAMCSIKDITSLKLVTAMKLFASVIIPIVTYGIELIWEKLSTSDLERMVYMLARET
ncbi:hypothetical protein L9F63_007344, partial [Diploptera punctata]